MPAISILKPVRFADPDQYECFASFCRLDYPRYEIVFGALDPNDSALDAVRRLISEFPEVQIRVVTGGQAFGRNRKACNLDHISRDCNHDLFVLCDSDMRVKPDYLRRVAAPLVDPNVGLATCLYRGYNAIGYASKLEALGIGADFAPSVLLANRLEGMSFAFGSTIALRRSTLAQIGGFSTLANSLADDYLLGNCVAALGMKVVLTDYVVDDVLGRESLGAMWSRRLRWARTMRVMRPAGWAGAGITHGFVVSTALLGFTHGAPWAWGVWSVTVLLRVYTAVWIAARCTRDTNVLRYIYLLPLNDIMAAALWLASFSGNMVTWRGERFRVRKDGTMEAAK